jgi:hypothetical protein
MADLVEVIGRTRRRGNLKAWKQLVDELVDENELPADYVGVPPIGGESVGQSIPPVDDSPAMSS